ncbi:MAG: flavodoxin-dependent (E)-4-hydroxy-3-methylbut-2-enyl-diphosphate synthase [Eubacteriales bacterium]|nr:flavodoxin-dependent (E)-4-hydroxy-3-methylbut-2-enyl-diphosphate synthase [Eubacteriales bacterium]MDD4768624.1 flavodoxin-dependent (E)-4-hydroxy-3-methylbut-2-enyl-diphosphate synthase [Eubacteriales bacterium]
MKRRAARTVDVGGVKIGGDHPIVIQSMTNTDTKDVESTVGQIKRLVAAGCELVRVAVPDKESARALKRIRALSPVPLVADIHFDYNLALAALDAGIDKLRINPGTIGAKALTAVVTAAVSQQVPVRIGVNSGSIHREYLHLSRIDALVKSALFYCEAIESMGCKDLVVSLKSSSVMETYRATEQFARGNDYPIHLGVTEAGTVRSSTIKSSIGIGALLLQGIGDTLRVSVTGPPESEIPIAIGILRALGLRPGVEIISCPTCGRSGYDVAKAAQEVEAHLNMVDLPLKIAVMGCVVNGPGEARHADFGIAFGPSEGVLFQKGEVVNKMPNEELPNALIKLIDLARETEDPRCKHEGCSRNSRL